MSQDKMTTLCELEGVDFDEIAMESVVPGICMNEGCSYTTDVEPDSSTGWCEECDSNTVKSATELILEGFLPLEDL